MSWRPLGAALLAARLAGALYDPEHRIESARLYGNIDKYAYYFVDLIVGTPPQRVSVILDTGSGVVAFPCANCGHCGKHIDPAFDFAHSSTAGWLPCGNGCRGGCKNARCSYHQGYTEGSSISGYWFEDWVRLGDTIQRNPPVKAKMGCHDNENNLFYTQKANGILGVGPGSNTLLHVLFEDHAHVDANIFAICFAEWGGKLTVGGHNASYHTGAIQYTPFRPSTGFYYVTLQTMHLNGELVSGNWRTSMVDSGTTYTYMGRSSYNAVRQAIERHCRSSNCGSLAGKCWTVTGTESLNKFPTFDLQFQGNVKTRWVPQAYLYRRGQTLQFCYAFEDDGPNANTVLGASWMMHQDIIFDMKNGRLGIATATCPMFVGRPEHHGDADVTPPTRSEVSPSAAAASTTLAATTLVATTLALASTTPGPASTVATTLAATTVAPTTPAPTTTTAAPVATTTTAPPTTTAAPTTTLPTTTTPLVVVAGQKGREDGRLIIAKEDPKGDLGATAKSLDSALPASGGVSGMLIGAIALTTPLLVCAFFVCRKFSARQHKYTNMDNESGMPPEIVGATGEAEASPTADTFVIDDDDDMWGEEDAFDFPGDTGGSFVPRGGSDEEASRSEAAASAQVRRLSPHGGDPRDLEVQASPASRGSSPIGSPVFSGGVDDDDLSRRALD